ncbi:Pectinesterase inhibitor 9 [Linum perenne]
MNTSPPPTILLHTLIILITTLISAAAAAADTANNYIQTSCAATTRYPDICISTLSPHASNITTPKLLASAAIYAALSAAKMTSKSIATKTKPFWWGPRLRECRELVGESVDRLRDSAKEMKNGVMSRFQVSNVQTWESAAMTCLDTCVDGLVDKEMKRWVVGKSGIVEVGFMVSNALAFVNKYGDGLVD